MLIEELVELANKVCKQKAEEQTISIKQTVPMNIKTRKRQRIVLIKALMFLVKYYIIDEKERA